VQISNETKGFRTPSNGGRELKWNLFNLLLVQFGIGGRLRPWVTTINGGDNTLAAVIATEYSQHLLTTYRFALPS
jgi:hypothetical protein